MSWISKTPQFILKYIKRKHSKYASFKQTTDQSITEHNVLSNDEFNDLYFEKVSVLETLLLLLGTSRSYI
jgi:hypothetical protein